MGNMVARLLAWNVITKADYVLVEAMEENIRFALEWIPKWAAGAGLKAERAGENHLRVFDKAREVRHPSRVRGCFRFHLKK